MPRLQWPSVDLQTVSQQQKKPVTCHRSPGTHAQHSGCAGRAPVHAWTLSSLHAYCTPNYKSRLWDTSTHCQSICALKKTARSMGICRMRPSAERCTHIHTLKAGWSARVFASWLVDLSVLLPLAGMLLVHSVPLRCNVAFLARTDLWLLHRLRSILSSNLPLPTTDWRFNPSATRRFLQLNTVEEVARVEICGLSFASIIW